MEDRQLEHEVELQLPIKLQKIKTKIYEEHKGKVKGAGANDFLKSNYLTPSQVLGIVVPLLLEEGIYISIKEVTFEKAPLADETVTERTDKEGKVTRTTNKSHQACHKVTFEILDLETGYAEEKKHTIPQDKESPQGYGAMLTYAERYFYMKEFNLANDDDDPDKTYTGTSKSKGKTGKAEL
jgi:hypothetical protein